MNKILKCVISGFPNFYFLPPKLSVFVRFFLKPSNNMHPDKAMCRHDADH